MRQCSSIIFPLILLPYVTRTLGVDNYGKVAYCVSIVSYFSLIAALGISPYAIREGAIFRDNREKINRFVSQVFSISILSTLLAYCLMAVLLFIWEPAADYRLLIIITSIEIIFTTISMDWVFNIYEDFFYITIRTIIIQIIRLAAIFLFVKDSNDIYIYALISLACTAIIGLLNFFRARRYVCARITKQLELKKHIIPILILFANSIIVSIYLNSDLTMLGIIKGDDAVGVYKLASQIYSVVKAVINAIVAVMIPRLALFLNNNMLDKYKKLMTDALNALLVIVLPATVGLIMVSPETVMIMGGIEYMDAVVPLQILSLALLFAPFGNLLLTGVLVCSHKEKQALIITSVSALVNIVLNVFMIPRIGCVGAAITTLIAEMFVAIVSLYKARQYVAFRNVSKPMVSAIIGGCLIIATCYAISILHISFIIGLILKIVCSVLMYVFAQIIFNRKYVFLLLKGWLKK